VVFGTREVSIMYKYLVHYTGDSLQVASIDPSGSLRPDSAFAFQYAGGVDLEALACILDKLKELRECTTGYPAEATFAQGMFMIHKFCGGTCSITINHSRVVFCGSIDRLNGLSKALRKANKLDEVIYEA
jgi:hypothetical protein